MTMTSSCELSKQFTQPVGEDADFNPSTLTAAEDVNGNGVYDPTAIFIPGVVEVFPLGTVSLPEALQ